MSDEVEKRARDRLAAVTDQLRTYVTGSQMADLLKEMLLALEENYAIDLIEDTKRTDLVRGAAQGIRQMRRSIFSTAEHPPQPKI